MAGCQVVVESEIRFNPPSAGPSESGFYRRQILTYKDGPFQCGDRFYTSEPGVYIRRNEILMYKGDPGT